MIPVVSDPESLTPPAGASPDRTSETIELLADRRRRAVLRYLESTESTASLGDLADHVTLAEEGRENGMVADWGDALLGTRRRVLVQLRHVHVPKLADAGAVAFDPETNTVSRLERAGELLSYLDADESVDGATDDSGHPVDETVP